ncbi:hypothetical protein VB636_00500, partial [Paracoccus sp. APAP_BH8]
RIFNPERQAEQYDPQGDYRRRWLAGFDGASYPEAEVWLQSIPPARPAASAASGARFSDAIRKRESNCGSQSSITTRSSTLGQR